jgi:hypothetical protein
MELLRPFWSLKIPLVGKRSDHKTTGDEFSFLSLHWNGGVTKLLEQCMKKSSNLDKSLDYEINPFSKVNGLNKTTQTFYLAQTFTSELSKINKNTK